ncbi:MAG: translation initiation factor [Phycisphaeraceae bacterium]|nr:translation initiation factor [Phycisphaeraceae bacterium]
MGGLFDGTPLQRPVTCERCEKPLAQCACPRNASGVVTPPSSQNARVRREKRRGSWTTVISGLDPVATDLPSLCASLKKALAAGGGVKGEGASATIEIQGDHRDSIVRRLTALGYPAKAAGG